LSKTGKTIGIDLGINSFVTLDDSTKYYHSKSYKTSLEKLQIRQRKLSLKKLESNNRLKQKKIVIKTHEKIANIREDFQHKLANKLLKEYDKICIEDLDIKNMLKANNFKVKKSNIQDASWGKFVDKLVYKAESAGKLIVKVDPTNTSKTCSSCGNIKVNLTLSNRTYCCSKCGNKIDRDVNAALNIKRLGINLSTASAV
jgi:putative transposase